MNLFGFNFTSSEAINYIKLNWKPGKREITYVIGVIAIFVLAEIYYAAASNPVDYTAQTVRSMAVNGGELLAVILFTFLYFKASDKNVKNALKWGVAYAIPMTLIFFVIYLNGSTNILVDVVSGILYLPADFFYGLLLAGGLYLLFVYRPKITLPIAGYVIMLVSFAILATIIYGFSIYSAWVFTDSVIGLSLIGLYLAIKNRITIQFPIIFLYAGIGLGFMILYWISNLVYLDFIPYYIEFLAFTITGVILYFLMKQNIIKTAEFDMLPPPPPPPSYLM